MPKFKVEFSVNYRRVYYEEETFHLTVAAPSADAAEEAVGKLIKHDIELDNGSGFEDLPNTECDHQNCVDADLSDEPPEIDIAQIYSDKAPDLTYNPEPSHAEV